MSRLGVSFADVAIAADELVQAGEQPTIEKIRYHLGSRGSFSTISRFLKDWREGRPIPTQTSVTPPDQVQAAVSAVWEKLHQETQATIEAVKAEAKDQVEAAREEAETANTALSTLKAEHETLKTQHHALSAQKELLTLDYKQGEANQQLLRERLEALESRHQEIKSLHEQQLKRLEEKYLAEIERLNSHTEQEVQLSRQLADTLKSHYEDARVDSMRQLDQLKVENQKSDDTIKRLEADNAGLKQSLEAKIAMHEQVTAQLTEAQKLIQIQQTQWDVLQNKRFVTEEIVAAFKTLPVEVASELHTLLTKQVKEVMDQAAKTIHIKLKEIDHA
jgi:DNA repair exonuclease SbcCD ATPase subunit